MSLAVTLSAAAVASVAMVVVVVLAVLVAAVAAAALAAVTAGSALRDEAMLVLHIASFPSLHGPAH